MDLGLRGKRALVLGASGGLGRAIAIGLAREGTRVVLGGRTRAKLEAVQAEIATLGGESALAVADLGHGDAAARLVEQAREAVGDVDILINNSGGPPPASATAVATDTWRQHFEAMVLRQFELTQLVLPGMRARGWGRILTIASSTVIQPIAELAISNTMRAALVTWSKSLAAEVSADKVTVNVLIPGRIATDRVEHLDQHAASRSGRSIENVRQSYAAAIPVGRYGRPEEFADVAVFLASERASYVTGSMVRVDGGSISAI